MTTIPPQIQAAMDLCPEEYLHDPVLKAVWFGAFLRGYRFKQEEAEK